MYKVLINGEIEDKQIDKTKKKQATENIDTRDDIWDNTIPLTESIQKNSPRKRYSARNWNPTIRYGFEDKQKTKGGMLYTLTYN